VLRLFLNSAGRLVLLALGTLRPGPSARPVAALRRVLLMAGFVPLFALIQLLHWIGFLLDELLFPGYRRVAVREPLFVLGVPRSGTTNLHRVLAEDPQFTTFSTWECLFAPSVTQRRLWLALGWVDARMGRPLGRLLDRLEHYAFGGMEQIHSMRLRDPEEDYFALMPVLACFILILPFPADPYLWRMGRFDRDMPADEQARLMAFYRGCLQRHLYVHGPDKRLLSKNAAFAPLAGSLRSHFSDARFLVCLREPAATLPSQLSSLEPGVRLFGVLDVVPDFRERLARQLGFYYENLELALGDLPGERCAWVTLDGLKADLGGTLATVYGQLGLALGEPFSESLARATERSRAYRSGHGYILEQFNLEPGALDPGLGQIYTRLAGRSLPAMPSAPPGPAAVCGGPTGATIATEPALPC
jgi:omega-hydroxy-beta-dihydromenaquinone-9 sulfotransferase